MKKSELKAIIQEELLKEAQYYRLDDKSKENLYTITKNYNLSDIYKTVDKGNDYPYVKVEKLISDLQSLQKLAKSNK